MLAVVTFDVTGASAFASILTGGISGFPRAAVGFVDMIERRLSLVGLTLGSRRRVAIGVSEYRLNAVKSGGMLVPTIPNVHLNKPWDRSRSPTFSSPMLDIEMKCTTKIGLLISSRDDSSCTERLTKAIAELLPSLRFCGGSIFTVGHTILAKSGSSRKLLIELVKSARIMRMHFISSRRDLVDPARPMDSLVDALSIYAIDVPNNSKPGESAATKKWIRAQPGWVIPVEMGYQAVSKPVVGRPGARSCSVPTLTATTVIGAGELIGGRRLISDLETEVFWEPKSDRDAGFYIFTASSF